MPREVNTTDTFEKEVIQSDRPVLVDFWGPRCSPCLALMPQIEDFEKRYGEKVKIVKIDASKNRRLCLSFKVLGLPTFLIYKNGKEVSRLSGDHLNITDIEESVKKIIE
ncbi:MAG: thioredoxin family protein [Nitrospirota bacterium]